MTELQIKSLEHILKLLESIDHYPQYEALIDIMVKCGIDNETRTKITAVATNTFTDENRKAIEASEWVKGLLSDATSRTNN